MPAPESDYRFQTAQLWERVGTDEYGEPKVSERESLQVRWENKQRQMIGPNGQPVAVDATVIVTCDIANGSIMWLGCVDDLPDDEIPLSNLMEVVAFDNTPDVKGRVFRKVVGLKRFNNRLPTIV
jgi:hypothetical protein